VTSAPGSSEARSSRCCTWLAGSVTGTIPVLKQLALKMSAKLGAIKAPKPASRIAHGACSRDDPQPKLAPATITVAPSCSGRLRTKSLSCRQS